MKNNFLTCIAMAFLLFQSGMAFASNDCKYDYDEIKIIDRQLYTTGIFGRDSLVTGKVCRYSGDELLILDVDKGNITRQTPYRDGKINGVVLTYFQNGAIDARIPFEDDRINGTVEYYNQFNGNISQSYRYLEGVRQGIGYIYNSNGSTYAEINYVDGHPVSGICYNDGNSYEAIYARLGGTRLTVRLTQAQLLNWENGLPLRCE